MAMALHGNVMFVEHTSGKHLIAKIGKANIIVILVELRNKMAGGRPRTNSPEREELIQLGEDLVKWASERTNKGEPLRVRFCDWYTDKGFIRRQWEDFRNKPEFSWYYEKARSLMCNRYIDGTVNQSIAHRYLRIYDPELRDSENEDADLEAVRKANALKYEDKEITSKFDEKMDQVLSLLEPPKPQDLNIEDNNISNETKS